MRLALVLAGLTLCSGLGACAGSTASPPAEVVGVPVAAEVSAEGREGGAELVFLANEGFLLRPLDGGSSVLIDAFVSEEYSVYGALPRALADRLEAANPPFDRVRLVLASHVHRDHFQPEPAGRFLAAAPAARLISSAQVIDALAAAPGEQAPDSAQVQRVTLAVGAAERVDHEGVGAEILRLDHGGQRHVEVENFGHVIHVGGRTVLHIGDAAEDPEQFARYRLAERGLDVALIPYWYFFEDGSRRLVAEHLTARLIVAAHIPPGDLEGVRQALAESHPEVVVLSTALESRSF